MIFRDGKLGGLVVLESCQWCHGKKLFIEKFCIMKDTKTQHTAYIIEFVERVGSDLLRYIIM